METIDFILGFCTGGAVFGFWGLKIHAELSKEIRELKKNESNFN